MFDVETYHFEYPSLKPSGGGILEDDEYSLILKAGIDHLDDLAIIPAHLLRLWTGISWPKIRMLYQEVGHRIAAFHVEKKGEIDEVVEFSAVARRITDNDSD